VARDYASHLSWVVSWLILELTNLFHCHCHCHCIGFEPLTSGLRDKARPIPQSCLGWLVHCNRSTGVYSPWARYTHHAPPPGTYGTRLILFMGLPWTWKVDATITKLGWTTYGRPFSKWPPENPEITFSPITQLLRQIEIRYWCLHLCFRGWGIHWCQL